MTAISAHKLMDFERLSHLEAKIIAAVPPISPPTCHWLDSDAGASYCRKCAWEARWKELPTFGPCPEEPDWFHHDDHDDLMYDGIDGAGGVPSHSDSPEACATCGCTLDYLLTEIGQDEEFSHYEAHPIDTTSAITGEHTYALTRLFMNRDFPDPNETHLAIALKIAEDTLIAIKANQQSAADL